MDCVVASLAPLEESIILPNKIAQNAKKIRHKIKMELHLKTAQTASSIYAN